MNLFINMRRDKRPGTRTLRYTVNVILALTFIYLVGLASAERSKLLSLERTASTSSN